MGEIRAPAELAENDYMLGMKYKDIADKYKVSISTVKSWKQRYKWDRKSVRTKKESMRTKSQKSMHTKYKRVHTKKEVEKPQLEVESEDDYNLTDKQQLFCLHYIEDFNATKAYQKAYDSNYATARRCGSRLLTNVDIKLHIKSKNE